jgi:hypothetical protein
MADTGEEADFVSRINAERTSRGLGALATDSELTTIARRWSGKMAAANQLSHNPNLSKEVTQDWEKLGENVGVGGSVADIHVAFMNSPAHRANILDPAFTHVGVGVVDGADGRIWVTEVFMRLRSDSGGTTTATTPTTVRTTSPTTARPPRTTTTAPPNTQPPDTAPPDTTPPPTTTTEPPPPPEPTRRLVLVLQGLHDFDDGI